MEMRRGSGDGMGWNGLSGTDDVDDRTWSTNLEVELGLEVEVELGLVLPYQQQQ